MYTYYVIFDSNDCEFERDLVFADNKKQAIRIIKNRHGNKVFVRSIDKVKNHF